MNALIKLNSELIWLQSIQIVSALPFNAKAFHTHLSNQSDTHGCVCGREI